MCSLLTNLATKFLENLEGMLPWYYMRFDVCNRFKFPITQECVAVANGLIHRKHELVQASREEYF